MGSTEDLSERLRKDMKYSDKPMDPEEGQAALREGTP